MNNACVLIVGAGPVGLTASILLSRLGVSNRVVEKRAGLHEAPQAHVVSARSMEIFRAAGVDEGTLRAAGSPPHEALAVQWVYTLAGPVLAHLDIVTPENAQKMLTSSPTPAANISQDRLEPVLYDSARSLGAPIDFDSNWHASRETSDGVVSELSTAGGSTERFESRFVLGCDGAASAVRRACGIEMIGPARVQTFMNVFVKANLRHLVEHRPAILYWHMDPESGGTFIAHDIDSTWIFMFPFDESTAEVADFTPDVCRARVTHALGGESDFEIRSLSPWVMTAQVAERYQAGRHFLVGDAAHRFPPTGGIGMNTGLADAFNLAWKIAAVVDGRATPALLETYGEERRDIARANSDQSLTNFYRMGEIIAALGLDASRGLDGMREQLRSLPGNAERASALQATVDDQREHFDMTGLDLGQTYESGALVPDGTKRPTPANATSDYVPATRPGGRLPHAWLERDGKRISTLDLADLGAPVVITGAEGGAWTTAARALGLAVISIGSEFTDVDGTWGRVSGLAADGAILVRPDRHVAWRSPSASEMPREALALAEAAVYAR